METYKPSKPSFGLLAFSLIIIGISTVLMGAHRQIDVVVDFYKLSDLLADNFMAMIAGFSFIIAGLFALLSMRDDRWQRLLGTLLILIALVPLGSLLSPARWIQDLGGFPVIGSGQGIIKYVSLLVIGLILWNPNWMVDRHRTWLSVIPVAMVLYWIGGMKFTATEAKGIQNLIETSPLMSWMYDFWDVQMTSNLIGIYDLLAASFIILATMRNDRLLLVLGTLMAGAVFIVTQTFLLSLGNVINSDTVVTATGHFLLKDQWYLINLITMWQYVKLKG